MNLKHKNPKNCHVMSVINLINEPKHKNQKNCHVTKKLSCNEYRRRSISQINIVLLCDAIVVNWVCC